MDNLNMHFGNQLSQGVPAPLINREKGEQAKVYLLIHYMTISRDSEFLDPAYVLLKSFLVGAIAALLLIGIDRFSENLVVSCLLFTSFTYLLLLIRDLDDPLQYGGKSSVHVD